MKNVLSRRAIITRTALLGAAATTAWPATAAASPSTTEGLIDVGGANLWYWDTGGHGPAIVLAHASSGSGLNWPYQQPVFAKAGYRVIGYSRRGFYGSSLVDAANPGNAVDDLRILADTLGLGRFHLLGIAAGGITVLDFALSYPDRLRSLTIASSVFGGVREPDFIETVEGLRPTGFDSLPVEFRELSPGYRATNPDGVAAWLALAAKARVAGSTGRQDLVNQPSWTDLEALRVRTLLITGDADLYMPPQLLRTIAEHFPRKQVSVIAEAGHATCWEQPTRFNRTVLDFL
jgi:pimeloyl-ACP methyl ester carboxylesterase